MAGKSGFWKDVLVWLLVAVVLGLIWLLASIAMRAVGAENWLPTMKSAPRWAEALGLWISVTIGIAIWWLGTAIDRVEKRISRLESRLELWGANLRDLIVDRTPRP